MSSNYHDTRRAVVNIGQELARRGWTLHGMTEDQSDSMTDYYHPAHWDGIATRGEYVACIDVTGYDAKHSGQPITERVQTDGPTCAICQGSGVDPSGWTLDKAQANPVEYNTWHTNAMSGPAVRCLFPDIVSPIPFRLEDCALKCIECQGTGHDRGTTVENIVGYWPTFQANPGRSKWHVEHNGHILAKGIGLSACTDANDHIPENKARVQTAVNTIVDKIERQATGLPLPPTRPKPDATPNSEDSQPVEQSDTQDTTYRLNDERGGVEIIFPDAPPVDVRDRLKAAGYHWSRRHALWYAPQSPDTIALAQELAA